MNKKYYPALDEHLYTTVLPNGLRIFVDKKPESAKKLCYFAVDFGAVHRTFTFQGENYTVPAGIAHYLEHKMFDLPGRDVSAEFAALGIHVNAFTGYDMTAYHISCTENFEAGLRLLLEFVSTPYFTAETVAKERGIILQEIGMSADDPSDRCFEKLMEQVYESHPIRFPVLGTENTIADITENLLYLCHRAFYTPENMMLCVVGDVDEARVAAIAAEVLGDKKQPVAVKAPFPAERKTCPQPFFKQKMEVAMPLFVLAFKTTCPETGEAAIRREFVGELAAEALFGESSALYLRLYEQGLIDTSFGGGFDTVDGCAMLSASGDSVAPEAVLQAILEQAEKMAKEGITEAEFLRMKRSAMGRKLRDLDNFDATCFRLCAYEMSSYDYFEFPSLYEKIQKAEVECFLAEVVKKEACALSVIEPL